LFNKEDFVLLPEQEQQWPPVAFNLTEVDKIDNFTAVESITQQASTTFSSAILTSIISSTSKKFVKDETTEIMIAGFFQIFFVMVPQR
jgi:hypothetical protein